MDDYVDLDRRFRELTEEERTNAHVLALLGDREPLRGDGWPALLEMRRVVMLAEAGSGKTSELRAQAARLNADGRRAFFIPIEVLDKESVRGYLATEPGEGERFDQWVKDQAEPGWFFLDAVDELKLTHGKLTLAMGKLAEALGAARDRARIIVSCRPSDWRPVQDMATFQEKLPPPAPREATLETGVDAFLAPFQREDAEEKEAAAAPEAQVRCVVLEPLSKSQIERYAEAVGVDDPKALLAEIARREAWPFARRPLDLKRLVRTWNATGRLGSLREQHESDVDVSLRDDPERADAHVLSFEKARDGAERLALAMYMTKTRTIRALEATGSEESSSLDAGSVLTDWSNAEIKALLRRPIFDPATYGRIRFHHDSVQVYLAAQRLEKLSAQGLSKPRLRRLLFADRYGEKVVIPSMRPVAAWLSRNNEDVRNELMAREPEALILYGDPETLPAPTRIALVRAYVSAYSAGGWRGLDMPIAEIGRLAGADLAPEINAAWQGEHANEEVREFLLKLVWLGEIQACAALAHEALMDDQLGPYIRIIAARALGACGRTDLLRTAADDILADAERWPARVVYSIADDLFPAALTMAELEQLIATTPEPRNTISGFSWTLYNLAETIEPGGEPATALRDMLRRLVREGYDAASPWHDLKSAYSHLTPALAKLCVRQLAQPGNASPHLIEACVVAQRFHAHNTLGSEDVAALRRIFAAKTALREPAFKVERAIIEDISAGVPAMERAFRTINDSLITPLVLTDRSWLLEALKPDAEFATRENALYLLIDIWRGSGRDVAEADELAPLVDDNEALAAVLADSVKPPPPNPKWRAWEEKRREEDARREAERKKTEKSWADWKQKAEAAPGDVFSGERRTESMWVLIRWLRMSAERNSNSHLALSNWREIRRILGDELGEGFEAALKDYWRENEPPVWSRLPADQRNRISGLHIAGLTGLSVEAGNGTGWASGLTQDEARRAAEWGLVEMNGFPEWFGALARRRPEAVRAALEEELQAELAEADEAVHPHTLQALRYGGDTARRLVAAYLKSALFAWPAPGANEEGETVRARNLNTVLSILRLTGDTDSAVAALCETKFLQDPGRPSAMTWLRGLCAWDLRRSLAAIRKGLEKTPEGERRGRGVQWFAGLFGDRDAGLPIPLDADVDILLDLTKLAYEYVRREDDVEHEGAYSPDVRDDAETARNRLLSALFEKPGADAHAALRNLASEPLFSHLEDRMRLFARRRAAADSEATALTSADVRAWQDRYEHPPRNRDELFAVMLDRLDDIDHDIKHHDFTDRPLLAAIDEETVIQPLLARKFSDAARGQYQVVREDEVADKKETDIRLLGTACPDRSVIEIKIGDKWSVTELEAAITDQLRGKYLRHETCTAGCLLVTYAGRKGFRNPQTNVAMSFEEVIERLKAVAASVEADERGRVRLAVIGLDLRAPAGAVPKSKARSRRNQGATQRKRCVPTKKKALHQKQ